MHQPTLPWSEMFRAFGLAFLLLLIFILGAKSLLTFEVPRSQTASSAATVSSPFHYAFSHDGSLEESGSSNESTSPYWWLDSGGRLTIENGIGSTMRGEAVATDPWRARYAITNPQDTDGGAYPQNLFRLISRTAWGDARIESSFRILSDNFTDSPNRNESNGILLLTRYRDENNFYYAGLRVDGHAVIKKKYNGTYYTLAETQVIPGEYENGQKINLLPHNEWITLRLETSTNAGVTSLTLSIKEDDTWKEALTAADGLANDTPLTSGFVGIRTDFMDVEFDDFRAERI